MMYENKIDKDQPARDKKYRELLSNPLIDPTMDWKEALNIVDNMVRQTINERVPFVPALNCKAVLDQYTPKQLISAWLIVARGYSEIKDPCASGFDRK